jgi:hypothetical protein
MAVTLATPPGPDLVPKTGYRVLRTLQIRLAPADGCGMTDSPRDLLPYDAWEPLPHDVAEWMGMDEEMLPFLLDLAV